MSVLDDAESKGKEKDIEVVLEEAAEDFCPSLCHYPMRDFHATYLLMLLSPLSLSAKALAMHVVSPGSFDHK